MKISLFFFLGIIFIASFVRFYQLDINPPGLYLDEVSIGTNAYDILTLGKDEHGKSFPIYFEAFGEYKLPVTIYLTSLSMALFGKTEFAIRFPSAFLGIATVALFFFFLRTILELDQKGFTKREKRLLPYIGAFLLAITPWHIQFSRGEFEANIALFLFLAAVYAFFRYLLTRQIIFVYLFTFCSLLTLYTYSTYRFLTPILVAGVLTYLLTLRKIAVSHACINFIVLFILAIPFLQFSFSDAGNIRVGQTAAFSEYKAENLQEKLVLYPLVFLKNYTSFFSPLFLFITGDGIGRHQVPGFGPLVRWELPFIIVGLYSLIKRKRTKLLIFVVLILFVAPLPAAIARPSPHTLRSLLLVLPWTILAALGIIALWNKKHARVLGGLLVFLFGLECLVYFHTYFVHYPKTNIPDWGSGYKQMVIDIEGYVKQGKKIYIEDSLVDAPIYFSFYSPTIPYKMVTNSFGSQVYEKGEIIWIRQNYGEKDKKEIIHSTHIPNVNHDVFSQFWAL